MRWITSSPAAQLQQGALRQPDSSAIAKAIAAAERDGQLLAVKVRSLALGLLAVWLVAFAPSVEILYPLGLTLVLILLGVLPLLLQRAGIEQRWPAYLLVLLDSAFLAFALFYPNPLVAEHFPLPVYLRFDWFVYFFVLLAFYALSYSPALVLLSGLSGAAAWSLGVWILARETGAELFPPLTAGSDFGLEDRLARILDPAFIDLNKWEQQVVVLALVAIVLAAAVWRARQLVSVQAKAERDRTNLARYFSPNLVDELVSAAQSLDIEAARQHKVAVLFADIVGFTGIAEGLSPIRVVRLLRGFHGRMAQTVFSHGGTIDKYIGDGVMATFGTPHPGRADALQAVACALDMAAEIERWNAKWQRRGAMPVKIGVGLHYGEAVIGNIGDERRLEYTVIGDTVNLASRLERLNRKLGTVIAVSDDLVQAAILEKPSRHGILARFKRCTEIAEIRGRKSPTTVWTYGGS